MIISSKTGITPGSARAGYAIPTIASKLDPVNIVVYCNTLPNFYLTICIWPLDLVPSHEPNLTSSVTKLPARFPDPKNILAF